jgi:hypothetical protein
LANLPIEDGVRPRKIEVVHADKRLPDGSGSIYPGRLCPQTDNRQQQCEEDAQV